MRRSRLHPDDGFTLVELLVSMVVLALLLAAMTQMLTSSQKAWTRARSTAGEYREARAAFEAIARRVSQATLNAYWAYNNPNAPTDYQRASELHFVCGPASKLLSAGATGEFQPVGHAAFFMAPLGTAGTVGATANVEGLEDLLAACGFFVQYQGDIPDRPEFMTEDLNAYPERKRFRLMEYRLPAENLDVFRLVDDPVPAQASEPTKQKLPWIESLGRPTPSVQVRDILYGWFRSGIGPGEAASSSRAHAVADNILAIILQPVSPSSSQYTAVDASLAPDCIYDSRRHQWEASALAEASRHQLPPVLKLTVIALDELSWSRQDQESAEELAGELTSRLSNELFQNPTKTADDLKTLEDILDEHKVAHRVFSTSIQIPAARTLTEMN